MSDVGLNSKEVPEPNREISDIQIRLKNLLWTVSGDYSLETEVDLSLFKISESIALYDSIVKGYFIKYFKPEILAQYFYKVTLFGAEPIVLEALTRLCVESAVWKKAVLERPGVEELRRQAFLHILERENGRLTHTDWGDLEARYLNYCLYRLPADAFKQSLVNKICALEDERDTVSVIRCIDEIYNMTYEKGFAEKFKGFGLFSDAPGSGKQSDSDKDGEDSKEDSVEEQEEKIVNLLQDSVEEEDGKNEAGKGKTVVLADESMTQSKNYIVQNYGKSYLSRQEQEHLTVKLCTGAHRERCLHFTDGLLGKEPKEKETGRFTTLDSIQAEYAMRIRDENLEHMHKHQLVTRQNILLLADTLKRALLTRNEKETFLSEYGKMCIPKLWNLGRTGNRRLFEREFIQEYTDFAVEVLMDSSGSQQVRQSMVALQGYIISSALSLAGLPHQVSGFCTFGDYTVMRRFRDYDDTESADIKVLEFFGSANNRDGLAVRAAAHSLMSRREEKKILIILSDGVPNDIIVGKSKSRDFIPYCGDFAVKDTAKEVYALRSKGIAVMGIFVGDEEALTSEKKIFGNEFAYIRNISNFSNVVGRYLRDRIIG